MSTSKKMKTLNSNCKLTRHYFNYQTVNLKISHQYTKLIEEFKGKKTKYFGKHSAFEEFVKESH